MERKYPLSKSGLQCLGPCFEANSLSRHPYTLTTITHNKPFCAVIPHYTKEGDFSIFDLCNIPTVKSEEFIPDKSDTLIPEIHFNYGEFIGMYYGINSFDDALDYVTTKKNAQIRTKLRIMNCAWRSYGKIIIESEQGLIITDKLVDFYIYVIRKLWIKSIFPLVAKYIHIENDNILISDSKSKSKSKDTGEDSHHVEKINYFLDKFANRNTVYDFMNEFIHDRVKVKETMDNAAIDFMRNAYRDYVVHVIQGMI